MSRVTSHEILRVIGLQSIKTLTRWHQRGLIPEPEVDTHPNGRGKIAYWPEWVLQRCKRIRDLAAEGMRLEDIADTIGCDWKAEERSHRERYRFAEVNQRLDYEAAVRNFVDLVIQRIAKTLDQRSLELKKTIRLLENVLFDEETVATTIDHVKSGRNPILVFDRSDFYIVPDFIAGQLLADSAAEGQPLLMKSIYAEACVAFAKLITDAPQRPTVKPAQIVVADNGRAKQLKFARIGANDFEFVDRKHPSRHDKRRRGK